MTPESFEFLGIRFFPSKETEEGTGYFEPVLGVRSIEKLDGFWYPHMWHQKMIHELMFMEKVNGLQGIEPVDSCPSMRGTDIPY